MRLNVQGDYQSLVLALLFSQLSMKFGYAQSSIYRPVLYRFQKVNSSDAQVRFPPHLLSANVI